VASRRQFLVGIAALSAVGALKAQTGIHERAKLGFLFAPARATSQVPGFFSAAMRDIGWVEGVNLDMEWRFAGGRSDRLPALAADLARIAVRAIVAPTNLEAEAALRATSAIAIVMLFALDPVDAGFASSLARPGGNVTGVMYADPEFAAKSVQLLKETVPTIRRFGYLYPAGYSGLAGYQRELETSVRALGLAFAPYSIARAEDISAVLDSLKRDRIDALRVSYAGAVQAGTARLLDFAAANRIATSFSVPTAVERGGLMSYSPKFSDNTARGAAQVDRLLKGAKAADMPFEYPTQYELVVNLTAARRLGVTVPQTILLRADRVIES
jgi:putative ABC transport system substrate-binding protein